MFDPTVFENLKVGFENRLYDLDNIEARIEVTGRSDLLDMAVMSRELRLRFALAEKARAEPPDMTAAAAEAEIVLQTSVADLAGEILETPGGNPACTLLVRFRLRIADPDRDCEEIAGIVREVWQPELPPVQTLSRVYGDWDGGFLDTVELRFNRQINEDQMEDIPELLDHAVLTLKRLRER